jgi:hypothetical protein
MVFPSRDRGHTPFVSHRPARPIVTDEKHRTKNASRAAKRRISVFKERERLKKAPSTYTGRAARFCQKRAARTMKSPSC